jgi:glycosyltransferase involved in cell wall biosynthesis
MIGVGITTRNRETMLKMCVDKILEHTNPDILVIVDDNSDSPVIEPRCKVINNVTRLGVAKSKNICLKELKECDHIFLFDDDCWPVQDNWEKKYIEASNRTGNKALCFTWDKKYSGEIISYLKVIDEIPIDQRFQISCIGKEIELTEEKYNELYNSSQADIKRFLNIHLWNPHYFNVETLFGLKSHDNPCGAMMYIHRDCLDTVGGFYEGFGVYGAEHNDYFNRAFNTGLTEARYLDVIGSENFFEAMDRGDDHHSSVDHQKLKDYLQFTANLLVKRRDSVEKVNL